jgi:co-chaperonin GroES (HSP10)
MNMNIKPTMDNVLIKVDVAEERSPGGLFLFSDKPVAKNSGVVVAVGDSEVIKAQPGDHVLFEKGMGRRFDVPEERESDGLKYTGYDTFILIPYFEIVAIVEEG